MNRFPSISRRDFLQLIGIGLISLLVEPFDSAHAESDPPVFAHGRRDLPFVALTFDDCYLFYELCRLEQFLESQPGLKVTFFPVGVALENIGRRDRQLWSRLYQRGHEFGYHSYDHTLPSTLNTQEMLADYGRWLETLSKWIGETPSVRFARPPFGERSRSFLEMCAAQNLIVAMWSTDWPAALSPNISPNNRVQAGDIIIFHTRDADINSLPQVIDLLAERRLSPLTMSELYLYSLGFPPSVDCDEPSPRTGQQRHSPK